MYYVYDNIYIYIYNNQGLGTLRCDMQIGDVRLRRKFSNVSVLVYLLYIDTTY